MKTRFVQMKTKINTDQLLQFPFKSLTKHQQNFFLKQKEHLPKEVQKAFLRLLMVIDAYLYSSNLKVTIKTFNSETEINTLSNNIIAFIYQYIDGKKVHLYNFSRYTIKLFTQIAESADIKLSVPEISKQTIHSDIQLLIEQATAKNENNLAFYQGWTLEDNKGTIIDLENVAFIREAYGEIVFNRIFDALKKTCRTNKRETVRTHCKHFRGLFGYFVKLAPAFDKLRHYLDRKNAVYYLSIIFNVELNEHIKNGGDGKAFCKSWQDKMGLYETCFIAHGIFVEPLFPLPTPRFKQAITLPGSHNNNEYDEDESSGVFNNKLITKVPLKYNDKEAIEEIIKDVRRDVGHVLNASEKSIGHNYKKLLRFNEYRQLARHKKLGEVRDCQSAADNRNTACATFAHYLWEHPGKEGGYSTFLGYANQTAYLNRLFCIPTLHILYPLIFKLVSEHPRITESWLLNWQQYDESGNLNGVSKTGNATVIRSVKKRRGMSEAEQVIKLNDVSKGIVDKILEHTQMARAYLKANNNDDYRYVLLTGSLGSEPSKLNNITNLKKVTSKSVFTKLLNSSSPYVSKNRAVVVANLLSINRMRSSCGVEVFLKTNSIKKMCEALGHKQVRDDLVSLYLPEPILRFFNDRWIRIFQNAIVYEAMQDSKYLYNAIDISPESLDEFSRNHRLKKISGHIWDGNVIQLKDKEPEKQDGAIVLSTPLFRVLLFFFHSPKADIASIGLSPDILETWTQLSMVIITQIEYQLSSTNVLEYEFEKEIIEMYKEATLKPLLLEQFVVGTTHENS
jgi:hypothetical protein